MSRAIARLALVSSLVFQTAPASPHAASRPQDQPLFRAQSEIVVVHVMVKDHRGAAVKDLPRDAFAILDDGQPQDISLFFGADAPATIGLLIDNSYSMMNRREMVIASAMKFAEVSNPDDEIFVLAFNEHVNRIWAPRLIRDSNPVSMRAVLVGGIGARGKTALYDALDQGLETLGGGQHNRQVLVVLSDGSDNASSATLESVIAKTQASDAAIFTVALSEDFDPDANPGLLKKLAESTGGEAFRPRRISDIPQTLEHIARDIRAAYTLGFAPRETARGKGLRKLRVVVKSPTGQRLSIRTRLGYTVPAASEDPR